MLPFLIEDEEADVEVRQSARVQESCLDGVRADAFERFHPGILGMHATAHALDDEVRREVVEVRFAASRRPCRAHVVVDIETGAENRGITNASRDLPRETARGRDAADVAVRVDAVAIDGAPEGAFRNEAVLHHRPTRVDRLPPETSPRQCGELRLTRILLVLVLLARAAL